MKVWSKQAIGTCRKRLITSLVITLAFLVIGGVISLQTVTAVDRPH